MAIYLCKICGNPMDPIVSDGICDDCYFGQSSFLPLKNDKKSRASSRSASSSKKKKSKIQKAAALIMALMIALSCLTFSAFADDKLSSILTAGTYCGYDVVKFSPGDIITWHQLQELGDEYYSENSSYTSLSVFLIDFDDTGMLHYYSYNSYGNYLSCRIDGNFHVAGQYLCYPESWFPYAYVNFSYNQTALTETYLESGKTEPVTLSYNICYTDGKNEFTSFKGSDRYLVFVPYVQGEKDLNSIIGELTAGSYADDFVVSEPSPEAGFITAKTPEPGKITCIDWVGAGTQYPLFDFWINDNHCYDEYVLRISSNDTYTQKLYDKGRTDNTIDWLGYNSSFGTQQINWLIQALNYDQLQWDVVRNITDTSFTFAESDLSNRRGYTICLSDYFSVVEYLLYRAEIIDRSTGKLVAVTYFSTNRNYNKGNSGYGSQVSHYTDDNNDGWNNDLDDGKFGNATETEKKDQMIVDNMNDIVITYDPAGISLDSFTDYLSGVSGQLGGFFTACWGIVPAEIMVIFLGGLTVMVTCAIILVFARR